MPRGKSTRGAHSESTKMDTDGTEAEIAKLQRQIKNMERDHQAYSTQTQDQIRKQQLEIDALQKEQEKLQHTVGTFKYLSCQRQDRETAQNLKALLRNKDMLKKELEAEKQCQEELKKEISVMELKLVNQRKKEASSSNADNFKVLRNQKFTATLEDRFHLAVTRLNDQLAKNINLREELKTLHIEHVHFQKLQHRLDKELQEVQKRISEATNLSSATHGARAEAQSKLTLVKEKAVKDLTQYNTEMKELERVIAHELYLKEHMTIKSGEKVSMGDSQEVGPISGLKGQKRRGSAEESQVTLDEVFRRIQSLTGEDSLDQLVSTFIQGEERNFALFNFVNEQNNEAEALRDQINQIQREIEQHRVQGSQLEQNLHSSMRNINEQQQQIQSQAEHYESQVSVLSRILDHTKTGVNRIFSKVECDSSVIDDMLGSSAGTSENNIMSYLGLLEQKTIEFLTIKAFLDYKDVEKDYSRRDLAKFLSGQNPDMLQDIHPSIHSVEYGATNSPVIDEEERPLSQAELRTRIMKEVVHKESSATKTADIH